MGEREGREEVQENKGIEGKGLGDRKWTQGMQEGKRDRKDEI